MLNIKSVVDSFVSLVGWKSSNGEKLSQFVTSSETGLYYEQMHPLLTVDNVVSIMPQDYNIPATDYDDTAHYKEQDIVLYQNKYYKCTHDCSGILPTTQSTWSETSRLSEWLEFKIRSSITKAILSFQSEKLNNGTYKTLFENRQFFLTAGRLNEFINNESKLVGFELVPARYTGVNIKIHAISLQTTSQAIVPVYIFSSECENYLDKIDLQTSTTQQWQQIDKYLKTGGSYYIVYDQRDLELLDTKAVSKSKDWSKAPCSACHKYDHTSWQILSKHLEAYPFYTIYDSEISNMWDVENNIYTYNTNYGLNIQFSVECDLSDFFIEQRTIFTDLLCNQFTVDMLQEYLYNASVRTNRHSLNASKADLTLELNGNNEIGKTGAFYKLDKSISAISFNLSKINKLCLPCKNNGVKYLTV